MQEILNQYSYEYERVSDAFEGRCVEFPGITAYGDTPAEALTEIRRALSAWLEVLEEKGIAWPPPSNTIRVR